MYALAHHAPGGFPLQTRSQRWDCGGWLVALTSTYSGGSGGRGAVCATCLLVRDHVWEDSHELWKSHMRRGWPLVAQLKALGQDLLGPLYLEMVGEPLPGFPVDRGHGSPHIPVGPKSSVKTPLFSRVREVQRKSLISM